MDFFKIYLLLNKEKKIGTKILLEKCYFSHVKKVWKSVKQTNKKTGLFFIYRS